jgi:hypothetical protein
VRIRLFALALAVSVLLTACLEIAVGPTTTTTPLVTTTSTLPEGTGHSIPEERGASWERQIVLLSDISIVRYGFPSIAETITVAFLERHTAATRDTVLRTVERELLALPKELREKIAPLRIYIHSSPVLCGAERNSRVVGCTASGSALLMLLRQDIQGRTRSFAETLVHEIGHIVDARYDLRDTFRPIHERHRCDAVSEYAWTTPAEDLAESFVAYARYPEVLKAASPERFAFLDAKFGAMQWNRNPVDPQHERVMLRTQQIIAWHCSRQ